MAKLKAETAHAEEARREREKWKRKVKLDQEKAQAEIEVKKKEENLVKKFVELSTKVILHETSDETTFSFSKTKNLIKCGKRSFIRDLLMRIELHMVRSSGRKKRRRLKLGKLARKRGRKGLLRRETENMRRRRKSKERSI